MSFGVRIQEVGDDESAAGQPHHPYAVFINRSNAKPGVVVANYDEKRSVTVEIALDDGSRLGRYRLVDDPVWRPTENGITLPSCSAAAVIE